MADSNKKVLRTILEEKIRLDDDLLYRLGDNIKFTDIYWGIEGDIIKLRLEITLSTYKEKVIITDDFDDDYNQNDWLLVLIGHQVSELCQYNYKKELENIFETIEKYKENMKDIDYLNLCNSLVTINYTLIE